MGRATPSLPVASATCRVYDRAMSVGPIVKSSPAASGRRPVAGIALLVQAGLRGFFLASFLFTLSRLPRLREVFLGNIYPLTTSIVLPAVFVVSGAVAGLLLLARLRAAAAIAVVFCVLSLLFQAFSALGIAVALTHTLHHLPTQTYVLMALNTAIYLGVLVAVVRSA
jgi:hypothetical protein